jgi:hypothetical protein
VPASVGARPHGEATAELGGGAHGASAGRGSGARGTAVGPWAPHPPATASSGAGSSGWGSMDGGLSSGPVNKAPWPADRAAAPSAWRRWSGAEAAPAVLRSGHGHRTPPPPGGESRCGALGMEETVGHGLARWAQILLSSCRVWVAPAMEMLGAMGGAWGHVGWCLEAAMAHAPFDGK